MKRRGLPGVADSQEFSAYKCGAYFVLGPLGWDVKLVDEGSRNSQGLQVIMKSNVNRSSPLHN